MAAPIHALIENSGLLTEVTGPGGMMNKLLFKHLDAPPFQSAKYNFDLTPNAPNPAGATAELPDLHAICAFNYMRAGRWAPAKNLTIAEVLVPDHDNNHWLLQGPARGEVTSVVENYCKAGGLTSWEAAHRTIPLYTTANAQGGANPVLAKNQAAVDADAQLFYKVPLPASLIAKLDGARSINFVANNLNLEEACWLLGVVGSSPSTVLMNRLREALCEFVIAMCKQGNCTERWLRNAVNDLSSNFADSMTIDNERVRNVYNMFSSAASEETMQRLNDVWLDKISPTAVRIKTIIAQSRNQGLTGLSLICEAINQHPDANWSGMSQAIGDHELSAAIAARQAFAGRPYISFNRAVMEVHGIKNYRKMSWVAREVLKMAGGGDTLVNYKGVPEEIPEAVAIRASIATYVQTRHQAVPLPGVVVPHAGLAAAAPANWVDVTGAWV